MTCADDIVLPETWFFFNYIFFSVYLGTLALKTWPETLTFRTRSCD